MRQRCQTEDPMQPLVRTATLLPLALLVPTLASAEAVPVPVLAWDACPPAAELRPPTACNAPPRRFRWTTPTRPDRGSAWP